MKLSEVQFQPWSTLVLNFYICQSCRRTYKAPKLRPVGSPCQYCGKGLPAHQFYFGLNSVVLVNAIQDFYFLRNAKPPADAERISEYIYSNETDTRIVIPILFCTLWDGLTTELCREIMGAKGLEQSFQERLLQDYRTSRDKRERLFPALTEEKWNYALEEFTKATELDYTKLFEFFRTISAKRNTFVHEGSHWGFTDEEFERIPEELSPTFNLFTALHDRYVPKGP